MGELEQTSNKHQLWVNLSSVGEGNIFAQLPELIKSMLVPEMNEDDLPEDEFNMVLASDYNWRIKIYFKLLHKMRTEEQMPIPWREEEEVVQMHHWNIVPKATKTVCSPRESEPSIKSEDSTTFTITWTVSDIAKAACLLTAPPINTEFEDEQEMRRVYTLIYDTFRYKGVLNQALNDISFYQIYPDLLKVCTRVWLLFFDLYHRGFKSRESAVFDTAVKLFKNVGLTSVEDGLWRQRTKLAAAVARLRIKNSALRLSELLPKHLRDERVSYQGKGNPVTCWINPNRIKNEEEVISALENVFKLKLVEKDKSLTPDSYQWDKLCPNFLAFHHSLRTMIARSVLVQKHKLVVQDRSFCLGPAAFGKIVLDLELAGTVVQSHVNSPRTTAYLATLLLRNSKIKNLLVFGAGSRKREYDTYFTELGMTNVTIYSDKLIEIPPDSNCLDRVIAVFATPPNSYSAVSDPIDLVCSRGGDLSMLEVLTESELTSEGKDRVAGILEEQRKTLRFAMSRPQIQLVLYETHSELDVENETMVQKTIKEMNKLAKLKHAAIQGKLRVPSAHSDMISQDTREINNNETIKVEIIPSEESVASSTSKRLSTVSKASVESLEPFERLYRDIIVPDCDLFDQPELPDLCPNEDSCLELIEEGCYLALLQRKEVTRLDNKYMIQMAEVRGLFGSTASASGRTKGNRGSKTKKQEKRPASPPPLKTKRKSKQIDVDRIAAPTQASIRHCYHNNQMNNGELRCCPKNRTTEEQEKKLVKIMDLLQIVKKKPALPLPLDFPEALDFEAEENPEIIFEQSLNFDSSPRSSMASISSSSNRMFSPLKALLRSNTELKKIISSRLPYTSKKQNFPTYGWRYSIENKLNKSYIKSQKCHPAKVYPKRSPTPPCKVRSCTNCAEENSSTALFEEAPIVPEQPTQTMRDYNTQLDGTMHITSIIFSRGT